MSKSIGAIKKLHVGKDTFDAEFDNYTNKNVPDFYFDLYRTYMHDNCEFWKMTWNCVDFVYTGEGTKYSVENILCGKYDPQPDLTGITNRNIAQKLLELNEANGELLRKTKEHRITISHMTEKDVETVRKALNGSKVIEIKEM